MLERRVVFEVHQLRDQGLSVRRIASALGINRETVSKYLQNPEKRIVKRRRPSKLDAYKPIIEKLLNELPSAPMPVILRVLRQEGYTGGKTILGDYLKEQRQASSRRAFIRIESPPGRQMQVDWGHFARIPGTVYLIIYILFFV